MKTQEQQLLDVKKVEEAVAEVFPNYTWEDIAMWMQSPQEFLFNQSPLMICATEDIDPLVTWLKERTK